MNTRKGILLKTKIVILFLVLLFLPAFLLVAGESYQINSYLGPEPTIDGSIASDEQQATGKQEEVTLLVDPWYAGDDREPILVEVGSCFTNTSFLYINTVVTFNEITRGNITYLLRKKGSDGYFDIQRVTSKANCSVDGYTSNSAWHFNDSEAGGTHDSEGKCYLSQSSMTFELLIPFNSGDELGQDLNITAEDDIEIEIFLNFVYMKEENWEGYKYYAWSDDDSCTIALLSETAPVPILYVGFVVGLIFLLRVKVRSRNNWKTRVEYK